MLLAGRAAGVALLTVLATAAVQQLVTPPLLQLARAGARAVADGDPATLVLPLDELVVLGAALALTACWLWGLLGVVSATVAVATARLAPGGATDRRRLGSLVGDRLGPRCVRTLTALALGVTALQAPAQAEPSGEQAIPAASVDSLTGLPLPDRAVSAAPKAGAHAHARPVPRTVRVAGGDSLWSIAARLLPRDATSAEVDRAWRRLAAANPEVLGPDPDLIFPGTSLRVPPLDRSLGKERP